MGSSSISTSALTNISPHDVQQLTHLYNKLQRDMNEIQRFLTPFTPKKIIASDGDTPSLRKRINVLASGNTSLPDVGAGIGRFYVELASQEEATISPGMFYASSIIDILFVDIGTEEVSSSRSGSEVPLLEYQVTETTIFTPKAGTLGITLATDHLGSTSWVEILWQDDAPATQGNDPNAAQYGMYFFPIATFAIVDGVLVKTAQHIQQDFYHRLSVSMVFGTTEPGEGAEPPEKPASAI